MLRALGFFIVFIQLDNTLKGGKCFEKRKQATAG